MAGKCQCCGVREGGRWLEGRGGQELNTGTGQLQCPCVSFLRGTNNIHWTMTLHINKSGYIIVPAVPTKVSMSAYIREQVSVSQVSAGGFHKRSEGMSSTKFYCNISKCSGHTPKRGSWVFSCQALDTSYVAEWAREMEWQKKWPEQRNNVAVNSQFGTKCAAQVTVWFSL